MASKKINVAQKVGKFTVMATSVTTKELYLVMVLSGEEVWDVHPATSPENARAMFDQYVTMCHVFDPVINRVTAEQEAGIPVDADSLVEELERDFRIVDQSRRGMLN